MTVRRQPFRYARPSRQPKPTPQKISPFSKPRVTRQPLSEPPRLPIIFRYFVPGLGAMLLLGGCLTLWLVFLQPLQQLLKARSWTSTECKIIQSSVEVIKNNDGTSYQPRIGYEYLADGQRQTSTRYSFFKISSGRRWAEKIADRYKTGTTHRCYYDPANPSEAVLLREFSGFGFWFGALFPWLFIGGGGMMLAFGSRAHKPKQLPPLSTEEHLPENRLVNLEVEQTATAESSNPTSLLREAQHSISGSHTKRGTPRPYRERADWQKFIGPQKLEPLSPRAGAVVGLTIFALIWNIVAGLFFYEPVKRLDWFSIFFMFPFLAFGIILIGSACYAFLRLFNPSVELALSEGAVPLGDSFDLAWELKGRVNRIRELVISAVGEEHATYTRGTDTKTDKRVFKTIEIARTSAVAEMQFGTGTVVLPLDTMHSHIGDKNKIVWKLVVRGEIPFFPDLFEEFEFRVLPRGVA
jgi:hypothetical protein